MKTKKVQLKPQNNARSVWDQSLLDALIIDEKDWDKLRCRVTSKKEKARK